MSSNMRTTVLVFEDIITIHEWSFLIFINGSAKNMKTKCARTYSIICITILFNDW